MSRIVMEKKICLEPQFLDEKLTEHLHKKIVQEVLGQCDQTYGYITKVYEKIQIIDNVLSTAGKGVFFQVKFGIKAIKPEIGSEYEGTVCMIFPLGIFVEIMGKMKVLIPADKISGYRYSKSNSVFKNGSKTISEGDKLKIVINMVKYEKKNFNCIGSLA